MKIMDTDINRDYWRKLAVRNGISRELFSARVKRGHSLRHAATAPPAPKHRHALGKTNPHSKRQKSLAYGLDEGALSRYRRDNPASTLSDHAALILLQARKHTVQKTLREQAIDAGLSPQLLYSRLSKQWPLEKALSTPPIPTSHAARIGGKARAQQKRERYQQRLQQAALKNASTP